MLPPQLEYNGSLYDLTCEIMMTEKVTVMLTYEHNPIDENNFLLSVIGSSLEDATANMHKQLKIENLI